MSDFWSTADLNHLRYRSNAPERDGVEAFQWLLCENPTLLPPAPDDYDGIAINRRARDSMHMCLRCGERAWVAYVAETTAGCRWLDLCPGCARWFRAGNDALAMEVEMNGGLRT